MAYAAYTRYLHQHLSIMELEDANHMGTFLLASRSTSASVFMLSVHISLCLQHDWKQTMNKDKIHLFTLNSRESHILRGSPPCQVPPSSCGSKTISPIVVHLLMDSWRRKNVHFNSVNMLWYYAEPEARNSIYICICTSHPMCHVAMLACLSRVILIVYVYGIW